jgi:hypothetical protein
VRFTLRNRGIYFFVDNGDDIIKTHGLQLSSWQIRHCWFAALFSEVHKVAGCFLLTLLCNNVTEWGRYLWFLAAFFCLSALCSVL